MRCCGKRMRTAYVAAGRFSKQLYEKGQGKGVGCEIIRNLKSPSKSFPKLCMEPQGEEAVRTQLNPRHAPLLQMPLCTLQGLFLPPGEFEPRGPLLIPRTGLQGKLAVNQQQQHLPTAAPCLPHPGACSPPEREALSFQLWLLPVCDCTELAAGRTLRWQELPTTSRSC